MPSEIVHFWLVAAGFLVADNLVLLPAGGDYLRLKPSGRFVYDASARLEARGRELVMLNPLDLFHRAAVTTRSLGRVDRHAFRSERQRVLRALSTMNLLSWIGYGYLVCAVVLAGLSFELHFGSVLASLLVVHLVFWGGMSAVLVRRRARLGLGGYQTFVLVCEALFVPAYAVNLGKRVWAKKRTELPAMTLGIRQARRMRQEIDREQMVHQLRRRLELLEATLPDEAVAAGRVSGQVPDRDGAPPARPVQLGDLVREAKACLTV